MSKNKKTESIYSFAVKIVIIAAAIAIAVFTSGELFDWFPGWSDAEEALGKTGKAEVIPGYLQMHVIDVGQGDCIFLKCGNKNILIDAGPNGNSDVILNYLEKYGVKKLDMVIATHPDADHIGSMDEIVLSDIAIESFYMPRLPEKLTPTTKTYESLLTALITKNLSIKQPKSGDEFNLENVKMKILAPVDDRYGGTNDFSIVCKFTYGNISFLMAGDAEAAAEEDMVLQWGDELNTDVLKVGHHGGKNSTSSSFLKKADPAVAVISVSADNNYDHPHKELLDRLRLRETEIYRTDLNGNVVVFTDGEKIEVKQERE